jgi:hypothetical protein
VGGSAQAPLFFKKDASGVLFFRPEFCRPRYVAPTTHHEYVLDNAVRYVGICILSAFFTLSE